MSRGDSRAQRGGPPRLQTRLIERLRVLLLINAPLFIGSAAFAFWVMTDDSVRLGLGPEDGLFPTLIILVCCLVAALSAWVLLPVARWCRACPAWHCRHTSRLLWALPACGGFLVWLGLWLVSMALLVLSAVAVIGGLIDLYQASDADGPPQEADGQAGDGRR
ncbi:MAG: hypothetical protein ACOCYV_03165 [Planctomycetota bacterium]